MFISQSFKLSSPVNLTYMFLLNSVMPPKHRTLCKAQGIQEQIQSPFSKLQSLVPLTTVHVQGQSLYVTKPHNSEW